MRGKELPISEQGLFERISEGVKSFLNPLHGTEDCLLFMIEENVKPRDTGTLFVACGNMTVFEVPNLALYGSDPEPVLSKLRIHANALRACSFPGIEFRNVSPWLQGEIQKPLTGVQVAATA
ncbi:MAG: hypothetical protein B7Z60_08680 [Ferrovum sp. 37-45-19]|nr:MAG: hypothetical protein B7Z60_08680 [Ferrovum sp. 37-45-19]OZB32555.1 MAG: hypothetical protein B7X47_06035 [Ferrovum sp. 34-44-207]